MELGSSSIGPSFKAANPPVRISKNTNLTLTRGSQRFSFRVSAVSYKDFAESALEETRKRVVLEPSALQVQVDQGTDLSLNKASLTGKACFFTSFFFMIIKLFQERYSSMTGLDGKTQLQMLAFKSPKIRLLRSMSIENETMQVFDFAGFMEPEYDTPIFCANFFTSANTNIVVLDLNPLHQLTDPTDYQDKYYKNIMSIYHKYDEMFPWGGKLTAESIKFFSPLVMWTRFSSSQEKHNALFSAFLEYYQAWLEMTIQVKEEKEPSQVRANREAQHKYLTWRAQKDPGHGLLRKLFGEEKAKELLRDFLFNGVNEMGTKTFIDYFPEYQTEDGTVSDKRSIIGKSFETRPWDSNGLFIG